MRIQLLVRIGVAGLCAAGVVASAITYRSDHRLSQVYGSAVIGRPAANTIQLANGSQTLHPDTRADIAKAVYALVHRDTTLALEYAQDGTRREPENAVLWVSLARIQQDVGEGQQARTSYARAKALDSQLPRTPYP